MALPPSDAERFLFTAGGIDFMVIDFSAREGISTLFEVRLQLCCRDEIPCRHVLGQSGCLTIHGMDQDRWFNGMVTQFYHIREYGPFERYEALLVPQAALLALRSDCRIFERLSVPQIVTQVFRDAGLAVDGYLFRLQGHYPPRDCCVQYRESDLAFVRRLLAHEGIYFFFEHSPRGHRMVFGDSQAACGRIPGDTQLAYNPGAQLRAEHEALIAWSRTFALANDGVVLRDYNFQKPALDLTTGDVGRGSGRAAYDYPGGYRMPEPGKRLARVRLEQQCMRADLAEGKSTAPRLCPGLAFAVVDTPCAADEITYLTVQVHHRGEQPQVLAQRSASERGTVYVNHFQAIPAGKAIRPEPLPKPVIKGVQTAMVTGPAPGQIHTDRHGRVRVRFHWERRERPAGAWVRVSQSWAGMGWGAIHLPRVGHEVIVGFEEGDPDRPMVTGRLYHAESPPPYALPAHQSVSTFKSRSTAGEGFNEIRFEDRQAREQLYLHAQRRMDLVVGGQRRTAIGRSAHTQVQGARLTRIGGSHHHRAGGDRVERIEGFAGLTAGGDLQRRCGGDHVLRAGGRIDLDALADAVIEAGARLTLKVGSSFVTLGPEGIAIGGPRINLNSGGRALTGRGVYAQLPQQPATAHGGLAGDTVTADMPQGESVRPAASAETPAASPIDTALGSSAEPLRLKEQLEDVVHITGEDRFYVLDRDESRDLSREIDEVQTLIDAFHQIVASADATLACQKPGDPTAECVCIRCQKQRWALKAREAGLLTLTPTADIVTAARITTAEDLQGRLRTLQQARDFYQAYSPSLLRDGLKGSFVESNWQALRQVKLRELHGQIAALQRQLDEMPAPAPGPKRPATVARASSEGARSKRVAAYERGRQSRTGTQVVEVVVFSRPDRRYYIRTRYRQQVSWRRTVRTDVLRTHPFNRQLATRLMADIKRGVQEGADTSALGTLEARLKTWSSAEDNLLNALHREFRWTSDHADAARYAVSAEAHLLRFAVSASAGVNSWQIRQGQIEVGVKASAAISLAEGKVVLNSYYPSQGGYPLQLSYRNGLGQTVYHPFGALRLHGSTVFSCFGGAQASADAGLRADYKPREQSSGATALLGAPAVSVTRGGRVGLKANAFAGARAGGSLSGELQWLEPAHQGRGARLHGQQMSGAGNWRELVSVKTEGNVAAGLGAGVDFGLSIAMDRLVFNCKASLVLGPGAAGGFGTVVDFEKIYDVVKLVCEGLSEVNYRHLCSITADAFQYIYQGLFMVATSPVRSARSILKRGYLEMQERWDRRIASKAEAAELSKNLLHNRAVLIEDQTLQIDQLFPETLGPMLYLLSESFIDSWEKEQEEAIVLILSNVTCWRHFIEVLEHMSPKGERTNALQSLNRINAILDNIQQDQFNRFIHGLPEKAKKFKKPGPLAWRTGEPARKKRVLMVAKESMLFHGLA